jgi:hypothetical protein
MSLGAPAFMPAGGPPPGPPGIPALRVHAEIERAPLAVGSETHCDSLAPGAVE